MLLNKRRRSANSCAEQGRPALGLMSLVPGGVEAACAEPGPPHASAEGGEARPKDRMPTRPPPRIRTAGLVRLLTRMPNTVAARIAVTQPVIAPLAKVRQPARSKPMETGSNPCCTAMIQGHP